MSKSVQAGLALSLASRARAEDQCRVPSEWNATEMDYARDACVQDLFEAQVRRFPDNIAVSFEQHSLTYAELDSRANQLAHYLVEIGEGPESLVGIRVERSIEMLVAVLGIVKAGAAYVPLEPSFPKDRVAFVMEQTGLKTVLTQQPLASGLPDSNAKILYLDVEWEEIARRNTTAPPRLVGSNNLIYVLYTSGSTGKPKGVQLEHRNLVNFLYAIHQVLKLDEKDVLLAQAPLSFDMSSLDMFLPLSIGAQCMIVSRDITRDGKRLIAALARATVMQATPATWRLLLDAGWHGDPRMSILCGGDTLSRDLARDLLPRCKVLWNLYGPTEAAVYSTAYKVEHAAPAVVPIGRPVANTQVYILDEQQKPVPAGVDGELYIGGDGVARGYLGRPDLTSERFVPDPFGPASGARLYRTGDLARFLPDGNILHLGRMDFQVKLRGFRIELGEIEAVLNEHPAVRTSVVTAGEDGNGEKRLVAYIVAGDGKAPAPGELRALLRRKLPEYMVPAAFVKLETLPISANGKVDRRALPAPDSRGSSDEEYVAPRNPVETRLVRLWEKMLAIGPIGVTTSFFDLGASSLAAARLFTQISREFHKDFPLSILYEAPTIEQFAQRLQKDDSGQRARSLVPIQPHGDKPPLFCVHGGGGGVLFTRTLVPHLSPDQPFYGLQSEAVDGRRVHSRRIEEMAARYIAEMREVQRHGPYFISGYCFGGVVAFEMARQLKQAGEEVALVALFNAANPAAHFGDSAYADDEETIAETAAAGSPTMLARSIPTGWGRHAQQLRHLRWREKPSYMRDAISAALAWRLRKYRQHLRPLRMKRDALMQAACLMSASSGLRIPPALRRHYALAVTHWAERHYVPQSYSGRILVFSGNGLYVQPSAGWHGLASDLVLHVVPGRHRTPAQIMREPGIAFVARELNAEIARLRGTLSGSEHAPSASTNACAR
jgi:amino acid adenylation domain-containing protein